MEYLEFNEDDILERVDEYSLYCYYMGYEPIIGKKYHSPLRKGDDDPSFVIFERKYCTGYLTTEYLWKDQAMNLRGPQDIFSFIQFQYGFQTRQEALYQICKQFNLGGAICNCESIKPLDYIIPKYVEPIEIAIRSCAFSRRDLAYWKNINVNEQILKAYNTTAIDCYWLTAKQQIPKYPHGLGYAYRINTKYQLYFPFQEKRKKFRNNWDNTCIPGLQQLCKDDLLIVTKAYKDMLCIRSFGYDVVAPKGENIMLPEKFIAYASKKYKQVVTLFDNDGKHKAQCYPWPQLQVPLESGKKDITDYCVHYGIKATVDLIKQLLHEKSCL